MIKNILIFIFIVIGMIVILNFSDHNFKRAVDACVAGSQKLSENTVANAKAFASALAAEGFDVLAESRGYTASHQVLTRHGELDSGAGAKAAQLLEDAGIITNMNMLPGDTKAMTPSGLRLGVQELTRVGMGTSEMEEVANFYARVLIKSEDPAMVKQDVRDFKSQYHTIRYCFNADDASGYPL